MPASLRRRARLLAKRLGLGSLPSAEQGAPAAPQTLRDRVAHESLRGEGLEIGALHCPVSVAPGVFVKYVDNTSRVENVRRFPELDPARVLNPDLLENGFELGSVPDASEDFVIANHVLEHSRVPLAVLLNWARVLRPGGQLLVTVPIAADCFDADRELTSVQHHVDDLALWQAQDLEALKQRDRAHYREWVGISEPVIFKEQGHDFGPPTAENVAARSEALLEEGVEIHFHTFSPRSYTEMLEHFCRALRPDFELVRLEPAGGEVLALLRLAGSAELD